MTRCDELNRWLDAGTPAEGAAEARAHAASCASCARALEAFGAMERALSLPPPAPPAGAAFTAAVMDHVRAAGPPALLAAPTGPRVPWWIAILSEPGFAVAAVAAAVLILTPATVRFDAGRSVALPVSVAMQSLGAQVGTALAGWFDSAALVERLNPLSRICILIGFAPLLVWAGFWMFGAVERAVRSLPARRG